MNKLKLKCGGSTFHASESDIRFKGISSFSEPKNAVWLELNSKDKEDIFLWMDQGIVNNINMGENLYGYLLESRGYTQEIINRILFSLNDVKKTYKYIFTFYMDLVELGDPFRYALPPGVPWTQPENRKIWEKSKLTSMLVSNTCSLSGHHYRLNYLYKNYKLLDAYGRGRKEVKITDDAMKDYMFTVSMENNVIDAYFTERLTSPMCLGTVPIYRGSKYVVEKYFDPKGVLWEDEVKLEELNADLYHSLMPHIKNNFEIALDFPTPEDFIIENYFQ